MNVDQFERKLTERERRGTWFSFIMAGSLGAALALLLYAWLYVVSSSVAFMAR